MAPSTAARSFIKKIRSFRVSVNATEFLRTGAIFAELVQLDYVALQLLYRVGIEPVPLQQLESLVPLPH